MVPPTTWAATRSGPQLKPRKTAKAAMSRILRTLMEPSMALKLGHLAMIAFAPENCITRAMTQTPSSSHGSSMYFKKRIKFH